MIIDLSTYRQSGRIVAVVRPQPRFRIGDRVAFRDEFTLVGTVVLIQREARGYVYTIHIRGDRFVAGEAELEAAEIGLSHAR